MHGITKSEIQTSSGDSVGMVEFVECGRVIEMTIYADHLKENVIGATVQYQKSSLDAADTMGALVSKIIMECDMPAEDQAFVQEQISFVAGYYEDPVEDPTLFRGCRIPAPYILTKDGIHMEKVNRQTGEMEMKMLTSTPLSLSGVGVNVDNEDQWVEIYLETALGTSYSGWRKYGELMCKTGAIDLMNKGLTSIETDAKDINAYLLALYINNARELPRQIMASSYGWKNNFSQFIVGDIAISADGVHGCIIEDLDGNRAANTSMGSIEEWVKGVAPVINTDLGRFKCYAMCAAPILEILGNHSFLVEHIGSSGSGKTTTASIARSMFAPPKLLDPTSTSRGIEKAGAKYGPIGLIFDETRAVENFQKAVYNMINVNSRATSDQAQNLRESQRNNTVIMTTGESSLLHDGAYEGIQARVLTLTDSLPNMPEDVPRAEKAVKENYGLIGPMYIQTVMKYDGKLRGMYERFLGMIPDSDVTQAGRRKAHFGVMALAGQILEEVFGHIEAKHPEVKGLVHEMNAAELCEKYFNEAVNENAFESQEMQALRLCYDQFTINPRAFYREVCTEKGSTTSLVTGIDRNVMGWVSDERVDFHKASLQKFLVEEGQIALKQLLKSWYDLGVLNVQEQGGVMRTTYRALKQSNGDKNERVSVISFDRRAVEDVLGRDEGYVRTRDEMPSDALRVELLADVYKFCDSSMSYDIYTDDVMTIALDVHRWKCSDYETRGIAVEDLVESINSVRLV